jgi:hypothetical protein
MFIVQKLVRAEAVLLTQTSHGLGHSVVLLLKVQETEGQVLQLGYDLRAFRFVCNNVSLLPVASPDEAERPRVAVDIKLRSMGRERSGTRPCIPHRGDPSFPDIFSVSKVQ